MDNNVSSGDDDLRLSNALDIVQVLIKNETLEANERSVNSFEIMQSQPENNPPLHQRQHRRFDAHASRTDPLNSSLVSSMLTSIIESNARLHAKIDYSISLQEQILSKLQTTTSETVIPSDAPDINLNEFKQIDTIEEVIEFEDKLENAEYVRSLASQFNVVCGPTSGLSGDNASYKLVDAMFTRRFFTQVSWTGLSRSGQIKENFSRFVRTIRFLHHLVMVCDPTYTDVHMKSFFRKIIDNSKRRYGDNCRRRSSVKRRRKIVNGVAKKSTSATDREAL